MKWILALCLALLPLSANANTLRPVDWTAAGFQPGPASTLEVNVFCDPACGGSGIHNLVPMGPNVSADLGELQVSLEFVSEFSGNRWTFGYRDLSAAAPTLAMWSVDFYFDVSAQILVPSGGPTLATLLLVTEPTGRIGQVFDLQSSTIGSGIFVTGTPTELIRGDQVHLFQNFKFNTGIGFSQQPRTFSPCGLIPRVSDPECLFTIELFEVVPAVAEPSASMLLVAGAGALVVVRRRWGGAA